MGLLAAAPILLLFLSGTLATCQNGGLPVGSTCNCSPLWTGDNCENILCINGGYASTTNTTCVCPTGYMGVHCDAVTTYRRPSNAFRQQKTSFNLVMVNLFSQYWGGLVVSQFQQAIANHLRTSHYCSMNLVTNANANATVDYSFYTSVYNQDVGLPGIQGPGTYYCYPVPFYQSIVDLIQGKNLRETAITIITQHPATSDSDVYNRLIDLATSFDIRINIIWSDDDTFVRCQPSDTLELMGLAAKTGGMFVQADQIENYDATNTIMDVILASHYRYEAIAMDYSTSPTVTFRMNVPYTKNYYVVALSDDGEAKSITLDISACNSINSNSSMKSGAAALAYSFTPIQSTCTVKATTNQGKARLHVFGSDLSSGPINVRLYKSYVESVNIDTSNTQPDQGNRLYLTLHVENLFGFNAVLKSAALRAENGSNIDISDGTIRDNSVFEIISQTPIDCQTQVKQWIELTFTSAPFVPETRFIPIYCVTQTITPPPKAVVKSWWTENGENAFEDKMYTTSANSVACGADMNKNKSLILAYSCLSSEPPYNTYAYQSIFPKWPRFEAYGEVRFDVNNSTSPVFHSQTDYDDFNQAVYTTYKFDNKIALNEPFDYSQVLDALQSIANSSDVQQNSLVTVLLTRFPNAIAPFDLKPYYPLVNKNVRVVFFMDIAQLNSQVLLNRNGYGDILNQIAAITGGHFIVSNQNDKVQFTTLLTSVYNTGAGQNLLFSKNIQTPSKVVGQIIGQIDLSHLSENVNITVTLTTAVTGNATEATAIVFQPQIYFTATDLLCGGSTKKALLIETGGVTNYYSGTTELPAGYTYSIKVGSLMTQKPTLLRVWSTIANENDVQVGYKDLSDEDLPEGPNNWDGAALAVNVQDATDALSMTLNITDCSGNEITLYDAVQTFNISDCDPVRFVPFFCSKPSDTSNCQPGTENLYFAQITTITSISNVTGFVGTKTFMCPDIGRGIAQGCNNTDGQGNYICGGNDIPYTRGPSGKLIDCSDPYSSHLTYNIGPLTKYMPKRKLAPYVCQCPGGTEEGDSCQSATCLTQNTNGGVVDSNYRTYSVVIGVDKAWAGSEKYLFEDANGTLNNQADNIWQYQLFATCYYGDVQPLYIGTSYRNFSDAFEAANVKCNSTVASADFNLTDIYRSVLSSVGRQQRGLVVFFHELSKDSHPNNTVDVQDLEAFIELAQQFKQQLYVYNAHDDAPSAVSDRLKRAVMMTGGAVITVSSDNLNTQFFNTILSKTTSLNAHEPVFTGSTSVTMEADGYLIVGTQAGNLTTGTVASNCNGADTVKEPYTVICPVASGKSVSLSNLPSDAWYSLVSSENAPVAVFISGRTDDQSTAFGVNYTVGGPTLAVAAPDGWRVTGNTDTSARSAQRNGCTFVETTVNVFKTLAEGYSSITLTMQQDSGATVNKVIPFGVSSSIDCIHGNANDDKYGYCYTQSNWKGPDNSIPDCKAGHLSTWGNACVCRGSGKIGQFCEKDAPSVQATTVMATTEQAPTTTS